MYAPNDMMVKAYQDQLYRDADHERLVNQFEPAPRSKVLLASLGRQMVKLGQQLIRENDQHSKPNQKLQPER